MSGLTLNGSRIHTPRPRVLSIGSLRPVSQLHYDTLSLAKNLRRACLRGQIFLA